MAPPIELDKPSTAPIRQSTLTQEDLQFDQHADSPDGPRTVIRDAEGAVAFPAWVPPHVESPESPSATHHQQSASVAEVAAHHKEPGQLNKKAKSDPLPESEAETSNKTTERPARPSIDKKYATDVPQHGADSGAPRFNRAATNVSMLDHALWTPAPDWGSDSSSDSESDTEQRNEQQSSKQDAKAGRSSSSLKKSKSTDERYGRFRVGNDNYKTKGKVSKRDGRLNITVNDTSNTGYLAKALGTAVKTVVTGGKNGQDDHKRPATRRLSSATTATSVAENRPKLNIVVMVIGSRGDIQPFLKIGKDLKEYGHRVRIATHPAFREFVEKDSGLEFFSVGGDPSELMAFMVKNPGMIPKLESVKAGDIGKRRAAMAEMFDGFWRACINATDNEKDSANLKMMGHKQPFVADAIIANPPSFAHIHCAEALGIPLHLMFTFPYTPTQAFPHPLAAIKKTNVDPGYTNFISYPLVEMMVWQGLGDLVNDFRTRTLKLDPVSTLWAPGATYRLHVPFTYMWSPGLVPKPQDWGDEIDVSGFVFLDLASTFEPPDDLMEFLDAGEEPIYIGFGSIVVDDADRFTQMIFDAIKMAGVRALVSKGWGGLGQDNVPENVFMLDNCPHDWLFPRVKACVIHGGAGTTAIALKCGKPTMVVPFFGDQQFWGNMIGEAKAGPEPVPYKKLNAEALAEGIKYCLTDEAREAVGKIAKSIEQEGDGAKNAVRSFHRHLELSGQGTMRCSLLPEQVAVWSVGHTSLRLSAIAANIAVNKGLLDWKRLRLLRHKEWNDFEGPGEPVTGVAGTAVGAVGDVFGGVGSVPFRVAKLGRKRAERRKKKEERRKHKQEKADASRSKEAEKETQGFPFPKSHGKNTESAADENMTAEQSNQHTTETSKEDTNDKTEDKTDRQTDQQTTADQQNTPGLATGMTTPATGIDGNTAEQYFQEVAGGFEESGKALARAPADLALALAQGFHNAPRLYGDDTVRPPVRVTGIRSGARAARNEFVYGIYDGVTGIVRLPVRGAKKDGFKGAVAGVGMGLTGFVLKNLSAIIGPFGYTAKGIIKQIGRRNLPTRFIRRARLIQGQREFQDLNQEVSRDLTDRVTSGWQVMRQLADLIRQENGKTSLRSQLGRHENRSIEHDREDKDLGILGRGPAFESVELAEQAIEAIKNGENVNKIMGQNSWLPELPRASTNRRSGDGERKELTNSRRLKDAAEHTAKTTGGMSAESLSTPETSQSPSYNTHKLTSETDKTRDSKSGEAGEEDLPKIGAQRDQHVAFKGLGDEDPVEAKKAAQRRDGVQQQEGANAVESQ